MHTIRFGENAWDRNCLPLILKLKQSLTEAEPSGVPQRVLVDFQKTSWCEPTTLLAIANLLQDFDNRVQKIVLDLGHIGDPRRGQFLTFLARQGFIGCFPAMTEYRVKTKPGARMSTMSQFELQDHLSDLPAENLFRKMDALGARLIKLTDFHEKEDRLADLVEDLISEVRIKTQGYTFNLNAFAMDQYFQRLRKFLFEAILNCTEHAYINGAGHASVYARVRQGLPRDASADAWHQNFNRERENAAAIGYRELNINSEWLEVFVCDTGMGILGRTADWLESARTQNERVLIQSALQEKYPLRGLGRLLFQAPLSRYGKNRGHRTSETGFLEIARTLNQGGGHMRILDGLEAIGGQFPWEHPNIGALGNVSERTNDELALGTCLCLSYQPHTDAQPATSEGFILPTPSDQAIILDALRANGNHGDDIQIFDRRFTGGARPLWNDFAATLTRSKRGLRSKLIVRLPKSTTKRDIGHWIDDLDKHAGNDLLPGRVSLVLVDVKGFHAELLVDFLTRLRRSVSEPLVDEISIVTIGFETAHLRFNSRRRRYAIIKNPRERSHIWESRKIFLTEVCASLKRMDTAAFWSEGPVLPISSFFENAQIKWSSSTLKPKVTFFDGYIDFTHALVDPQRYRTCQRALYRILIVLKPSQVFATDELVAPLLTEIEHELGLSPSTSGLTVLVASVEISGSTVARFNRQSSYSENVVVTFFNRNISLEDRNVTLIDWHPPELPKRQEILERVSGTAFVARHGDYGVRANRMFRQDDGEVLASFYPRSPGETYADFSQLDAIRLNHHEASRRHDLLAFRASETIDRCTIDNNAAWKWIKDHIDGFVDQKSNYVVVFPNSRAANAIIQNYLERRPDSREIARRFFPLNFLRQRKIQPYLISPLIEEKLTKLFGAGKEKPEALVVDSVTFSGDTLRQITQLLQSCSVRATGKTAEVHTLALLDRSGFPAYDGVMYHYNARHHRYWRWDVPHLGGVEGCSLCNALARAEAVVKGTESLSLKNTVEEWLGYWKAKPGRFAEDTNPDMDLPLPEPASIKFGIVATDDAFDYHSVTHTHSLNLVATLAELTRITHRSDIAIRWAAKYAEVVPLVALQILSVNLLLFATSFRYWERIRYFREIMDILFRQGLGVSEHEKAVISLASIALLLIDEETLEDLDRIYIDAITSEIEIKNVSVCAAMAMLFSGKNKDRSFSARRDIKGRNLQRFRVAENGLSGFADLFDVVGLSASEWHRAPLQRAIDRTVRNAEALSPTDLRRLVLTLIGVIGELELALERIVDSFRIFEPLIVPGLSPDEDLRFVRKLRKELITRHFERDRKQALRQLSELRSFLYDGTQNNPGLAIRYTRSLFFHAERGASKGLFFARIRSEFMEEWESYARSKPESASHHWVLAEALRRPVIVVSDSDVWDSDFFVFTPEVVWEAIKVTFQNVIHSDIRINSPWNDDVQSTADMWLRLNVLETYLEIDFASGSSQTRAVELHRKDCYDRVVTLGGSISNPTIVNGIYKFKLRIPMMKSSRASRDLD
ncbi:hypothetical protein GGI64_004121 [Rhizobium leguminosarum]|uniref:Uncharacterized protein n=1 Tax=Rhizobium leguminosarum TaxID=384 RepID=A0A7Z0IZG2_RHILE|nr:hypothetical protein [Rhizobium leguminosarum]NYJ13040.1 hypothetical protein [Rhizobium leguminosarum]